LAVIGVLVAAFASLATSDIDCPRVASLPDTAQLDANASLSRRYSVSAPSLQEVRVIVSGTSEGDAAVRVRLVPDDPTLFPLPVTEPDAGVTDGVELALRPMAETSAELTIPRCKDKCETHEFSLFVEHLGGASAALRWEVIVETEACGDFHARIDRL